MRQAPFALWIHDLSARDPFFVLPVLMAAAMFFQTRMSPAPPDPVQARMMQIMPLVFAGLLDLFPGRSRALSADEHDAVDLAAVAHQHDRRARVGRHVARTQARETRLALRRHDTIAALATAPGVGAIAVVRLSGPKARDIARALTGRDAQPRLAELRTFRDASGATLDRGLVLFFPGPRSFTGEDVVELHCHGGRIVGDALLAAVYLLGARPAEAGEFTLRAFLNDKIDLLASRGDRRSRRERLRASGARGRAVARRRVLSGRHESSASLDEPARPNRSLARLSRRGAAVRCGARMRGGARRARREARRALDARALGPRAARRAQRRDRGPAERGQVELAESACRLRRRDRHGNSRHDARPAARAPRARRPARHRRRHGGTARHATIPSSAKACAARSSRSRAPIACSGSPTPASRSRPRSRRPGPRTRRAAR